MQQDRRNERDEQVRDGRQPGGSTPRARSLPRPLAVTLLAVPVVATAGAFGIPALAASSGQGPTRLTSTEAVAEHPTSTQDAVLKAQDATRKAAQEAAKKAAARKAAGVPVDAGAPRVGHTESPDPDAAAITAFFDRGYDYDDAARLAKLWHATVVGGDLSQVKAAAGRNLLAGRPLTARPANLPSYQDLVRAFQRAGYDYQDAVLLARVWGVTASEAKARAGQKLLIGSQPPVRPGQTAATVSDDAAISGYFSAGYDYDDAVRLAAIWHQGKGDDLTATKVAAGRKILAGIALPVRP